MNVYATYDVVSAGNVRMVVAATSQPEAARLCGLTVATFRTRSRIEPPVTDREREMTLVEPGVVFYTTSAVAPVPFRAAAGFNRSMEHYTRWDPEAQAKRIAWRANQIETRRRQRAELAQARERDQAERTERAERSRDQEQRRREADQAAREMLDDHAELLEEVGLTDLRTNGDGNITLPVEALIGVIRRL